MRILGIDPGFDRVGICVLEKVDNHFKYIFSCLIETDKALSYYDRLLEVQKDLSDIIKQFKPDKAVIEKLFFATNQKTALLVAQSRGVIALECYKNGIEVVDVSPTQMKLAVTGDGRATKEMVGDMVFRQLKLTSANKVVDDTVDAMGLALMG